MVCNIHPKHSMYTVCYGPHQLTFSGVPNDCNLLLHLTTTHAFENVMKANDWLLLGCGPPVLQLIMHSLKNVNI